MHELRRQLRASGAKWVAERNGAAVDVDLLFRHSELAHHRDDLRRERLVELDEVDVLHGEAGLLEHLRHRLERTHAHDVGLDASHRESNEPREGPHPALLGERATHQQQRRGAVGVGARVTGRHRAIRLERRPELRESLRCRLRAHELVLRERQFVHLLLGALPAHTLDGHRDDLRVEAAVHRRGRGLLLAAQSPRILLRSTHLPPLGHALRGESHADVRLHRVRVEPRVIAGHRDLAHHLDATREHDVSHAAHDLHGAVRDGLESGGAEAIDGLRRHVDRDSRAQRAEPRDIESLRGLRHRAAPDHVVDAGIVEPDSTDGFAHDECRQLDGMRGRERAVFLSLRNGGANGGNDHDFVFVGHWNLCRVDPLGTATTTRTRNSNS